MPRGGRHQGVPRLRRAAREAPQRVRGGHALQGRVRRAQQGRGGRVRTPRRRRAHLPDRGGHATGGTRHEPAD